MSGNLEDLFPDSPRVFYRKAPLLQVICQFRFPPILRIEAEPPADFQEKIRAEFPLLERVANPLLPMGMPPEVAQSLGAATGTPRYVFLTENRSATVGLSSDSLTIDTRSYSRWEEFSIRVGAALCALVDVYHPSFLSRVGLRYQDFIDREKIGIADRPWSSLLCRDILGELHSERIEKYVRNASRAVRAVMPTGQVMLLQHGIGRAQNSANDGYVIDFDFAVEKRTEVSDAESTLNQLHRGVGKAFRWCITTELHDALDPVSLDDPAAS